MRLKAERIQDSSISICQRITKSVCSLYARQICEMASQRNNNDRIAYPGRK